MPQHDAQLHHLETVLSNVDDKEESEVVKAVEALVSALKRNRVSSPRYQRICSTILDSLPSLLSILSLSDSATAALTQSFLLAHPAIAFTLLCSALNSRSNETHYLAHVLQCFVSTQNGASHRLGGVMQHMQETKTASSLLHLPTIVANALALSPDHHQFPSSLSSQNYYPCLCDALCSHLLISDYHSQPSLAKLLSRIALLGHADHIIQSCSSHSAEQIVSILVKAPQTAVQPLLIALLSFHVDAPSNQSRICAALPKFLSLSVEARQTCTNTLPLSRALLPTQRTSLQRLVSAVSSTSSQHDLFTAICTCIDIWSSTDFVLGADLRLQRQVTRLLLYYMLDAKSSKAIMEEDPESVMLAVVSGVEHRLGESNLYIRRHGMLVVEAVSSLCSKSAPVQFDMSELEKVINENPDVNVGEDNFENESDADFAQLAAEVGAASTVGGVSTAHRRDEVNSFTETPTTTESPPKESRRRLSTSLKPKTLSLTLKSQLADEAIESITHRYECQIGNTDAESVDWQTEDDWSSVCSWEDVEPLSLAMPSDVNLEYSHIVALQKEISSPMSLPRLLTLFRDAERRNDGASTISGETIMAALRLVSVSCQATHQRGALKSTAVDLLLEVNRVDAARYPDEFGVEMRQLRAEAMESIGVIDMRNCGIALIDRIICHNSSDISSRLEALDVLSSVVRTCREKRVTTTRQRTELQRPNAVGTGKRVLISVANEHNESKSMSKTRIQSEWDEAGAEDLFFHLANGLIEIGVNGSFVELEGRDVEVWSHGLVTLATIAASCIGTHGGHVRREAMRLFMRRLAVLNTGAVMRRAIALALGAIVDAMSDDEVRRELIGGVSDVQLWSSEEENVGQECYEWLVRAREDGDGVVRRFARMSLAKWVRRVEMQV